MKTVHSKFQCLMTTRTITMGGCRFLQPRQCYYYPHCGIKEVKEDLQKQISKKGGADCGKKPESQSGM